MKKVSEKKKKKEKKIIKKGMVNGVQKYYNKETGKYFLETKQPPAFTKEDKILAIRLILEGMSFRGAARIVGCHHVSVINWVYAASETLKNTILYKKSEENPIIEMDEVFHFCQKKRKNDICGPLSNENQGNL